MNRRFPFDITAFLIIMMTCFPVNAQLQPGFLQLPQHSVATVEGALSPVVNPAGLGIYNGESLLIMAPYLGKADFGDWGFALGGEDIGFITEVKRNSVEEWEISPEYDWIEISTGENNHQFDGTRHENRARYTWGLGFGYRMLSFGTAYSYTSGIDRQNNWDIGIMARPFQFLSLGAVARGINNPRLKHQNTGINIKPDVGWDLGIAIRPTVMFKPPGQKGGQRLTLYADASLRQFNRIGVNPPESYQENIAYKYGASAQIAPGIIGYVDYLPEVKEGIYANEEQIYGGLSLSFGKVEVGGFQRHGKGEGISWIAANNLYRHTLLRRPSEKFVEIRLSGPLVEYQPSISWFTPRHRTVYELLRQIEKYGNDPDVAGILLRLDDFSAGWAKLQEIRKALLEFEYTGKSLIVYLETCGNGGYYLASVADNIFMNPVGEIGLTGLSAHSVFVSRTLDMAGIDPEFEHVGKYKSATETYTREDMSDEMREEIEYILDDLFDDFVAKIADGRGYITEQMLELIDDGPFSAADAYSAGLVDELIYEDEIEDVLKEYVGENIVLIKEKKFNRRLAANDGWYDLRRKSIAIVYASGAIMRGESSEAGLFSGEIMGSTTISKALQRARKDKSVKAIVLRIDSPGGSMLASEIILREVKRCSQGDDPKPIIVSMSDVAGSGGYYIACMADSIVAMPGTITGSIGVISGKMAYYRLQNKLGISSETITRGKHAGMWASYRSFTDEEWTKVRQDIDHSYNVFLERVAEGRSLDTSEVSAIAQGRIWTGSQAEENGLVDRIGGLDLALTLAAYMGGIKDAEAFIIKMYPRRSDFGLRNDLVEVIIGRMPESFRTLMSLISEETRWEAGEPLLLMPYRIEIE